MGGGTGPRNVLSTTGQECEVSFSKVLRCVSGPNTVVAGAAWMAGVSRGGGGALLLWSTPGLLSAPCHCWPWCPGSCSTPDPVFPPMLGGTRGSAGESGLQEKPGMLPGPEPALGQSWNVVCPLSRAAPPQHLRLHHEAGLVVLTLLWGTDDNLRQLTGREVPVRQLSVHSLPTVTAQATLVPSKLCSHRSVSPQYLPIHWGCQLGATSRGRRTLHPGLGPSGTRQPWWKAWAWLPRR